MVGLFVVGGEFGLLVRLIVENGMLITTHDQPRRLAGSVYHS